MQHKRRSSGGKVVLITLGVLVIGGFALLMTLDIPAQQKPVEQVLDAKAFLESKPAE